jgi:hypothetical protein
MQNLINDINKIEINKSVTKCVNRMIFNIIMGSNVKHFLIYML